jgi:hypothetical protein
MGITNLGDVPDGMSFYEAIRHTIPQRKYTAFNPQYQSRRLTFCETAREIYRETLTPSPDLDKIRELCASLYDFGKRMDARMKEARERES